MSMQTRFALQVWPFVLALALLFTAQYLEQKFLPVVADFRVTSLRQQGPVVTLSGHLKKIRDCDLLGVVATLDDHGRAVQIPLVILTSNPNLPRDLPIGGHSWGTWELSVPQAVKGSEIVIRSVHSCHPAWTTTTRLAEFALPEGVLQ